jgi:hypothetical protein
LYGASKAPTESLSILTLGVLPDLLYLPDLALCLFEVESLQSSPVVAQALRTEATIKMVNSLVNRDSEDEAENFCIML